VHELPAGQRVVTPDIRGHGSASERQPADLPGVMADVVDLMSDRCLLGGYSMGGRLALHLALDQPGRIRHLVLIGASPGLADPAERRARKRADEELASWIERSTIHDFAVRWAQTPILAGLPPEVATRASQDRLRNTPAGLARALRGLGTAALPSLWERLGELTMPVSLVVGERDQKFRGTAREMAALIPQAEVVVVPDAGHAVHLEAPDRVAEVISAAHGSGPR
jgi:2-succinyl-6-hydroxy-2,4-cyclohexadiene-1-carboxylate synthase